MNNFDTVRLALTFDGWTPDDDEHRRWIAKALAALAQIEADHYSAADMADAQAKAFRSGVASVTAGQEPVAWMVTTELQDGTRSTYPLSGRYKDVSDACDFGEPVPLYAAPVAQQARADLEAENQRLREALEAMQRHVEELCTVYGVSLPQATFDKARNALESKP